MTNYFDKFLELDNKYVAAGPVGEIDYVLEEVDYVTNKELLEATAREDGVDVNSVNYIHRAAYNQGYREGFALATKTSNRMLEASVELLRQSEERNAQETTLATS